MHMTGNIHLDRDSKVEIRDRDYMAISLDNAAAIFFQDREHLEDVVRGLYEELFPAPAPLPASHPANLPPVTRSIDVNDAIQAYVNNGGNVSETPGERVDVPVAIFDAHAAKIRAELAAGDEYGL